MKWIEFNPCVYFGSIFCRHSMLLVLMLTTAWPVGIRLGNVM